MNKDYSSGSGDTPRPDANTLSGNGQSGGASRDGSNGAHILLVDDNPEVARAMAIALELAGHRLDVATSPEEGFSRLATQSYDAILLDMNFSAGRTGGEEGLAMLERLLRQDPAARVVVITAHSGIRIAVAAMQAGARDFIMKPWRNPELVAKVEAAMVPTTRTLSPSPGPHAPVHLLGESVAMADVRRLVARIGPTAASVGIIGPAGSGRALVARALHALSTNADRPLAEIDARDESGWSMPNGGDLLLRHADRLDDVAQERLLRRLPQPCRVFAPLTDSSRLSPALRARIATVEISVPPLSARGADALALARHFARTAAERHGRPVPQLSQAAEALILNHPWPDEVRGLQLAVERALLLSEDGRIDVALLAPQTPAPIAEDTAGPAFDLLESERAMIAAALREHGHNVTQAAQALGLSRGALYRRMARHGL
ncbi:MAG: Fis family transcriptional regulator [Sphingomonas sp.]|nr:MAG: Fis family transcriptional regulator [Sphingomonas sp.]